MEIELVRGHPPAQARRGRAGRRPAARVVPALDVAGRRPGGRRGARRTHAAPGRPGADRRRRPGPPPRPRVRLPAPGGCSGRTTSCSAGDRARPRTRRSASRRGSRRSRRGCSTTCSSTSSRTCSSSTTARRTTSSSNRFPLAERARGFLIAKDLDPDDARRRDAPPLLPARRPPLTPRGTHACGHGRTRGACSTRAKSRARPQPALVVLRKHIVDRRPRCSFLLSVVLPVPAATSRSSAGASGGCWRSCGQAGSGIVPQLEVHALRRHDHRVIFRTGVLAKRGVEIPLDRIYNINFHQSIWERVIGAGDLEIESAGHRRSVQIQRRLASRRGAAGALPADGGARPQARGRRAGRAAAAGGRAAPRPRRPSIPDQLNQLAELRDRGVITAAEFEAKKAQLLERM